MALNSWQKLDWVLPGKPFGTYLDGDYSSSTAPTMTYLSCSGTAGTKTLTVGANSLTDGTVLKVVYTRGTNGSTINTGIWEYVRIASGGGTTTFTLSRSLVNTYVDSGNDQSQAIKVWQYKDVTVQSGTWTPTSNWNKNIGGEIIFACKNITTTGNISVNSSGFYGGPAGQGGDGRAYTGEGSGEDYKTPPSPPTVPDDYKNPNGSGGGIHYVGSAGGGNLETIITDNGGGNVATGTLVYNAQLTEMSLGAGGGGGTSGTSSNTRGGYGAGCITIIARTFNSPTGVISANGETSPNSPSGRAGSGGAGGCILIVGKDINIGTNKITANYGGAGSGTSSNNNRGSYGRVAVYYSGSITGSMTIGSGGYHTCLDPTLIETSGAWFMFL